MIRGDDERWSDLVTNIISGSYDKDEEERDTTSSRIVWGRGGRRMTVSHLN